MLSSRAAVKRMTVRSFMRSSPPSNHTNVASAPASVSNADPMTALLPIVRGVLESVTLQIEPVAAINRAAGFADGGGGAGAVVRRVSEAAIATVTTAAAATNATTVRRRQATVWGTDSRHAS